MYAKLLISIFSLMCAFCENDVLPELAVEQFTLDSIQVLHSNGTPANIHLAQSATDYIGLTTGSTTTFKLKFHFPAGLKPASIYPNPDDVQDYRTTRTFTVTFTPKIIKTYTVTIAQYDPLAFDKSPFKGVWLTNVGSDALYSSAGIETCVNLCKELGISTIFMVVYNDGKTMYPSKVMQEYFGQEIDPAFAGRDPLAELLQRATPHHIRVIPWFEYGFASVYKDASGGAILRKYPNWASLDYNGRITQKNNFYWLDPFNPEVQQFIKKLMLEVVVKYPGIAGVQGDDRLPALPSNGGYNPYILERYKLETGNTAPANHLDPKWLQWRADKLTAFGKYIYNHVKAIDSRYIVSWSPSPYNWSLENYLQDWPAWIQQKQVDFIHPQFYRSSFAAYKSILDSNRALVNAWEYKDARLNPGVLIGTGDGESITPEILEDILTYNRSIGIQGETYFYYERILKNPAFQAVIKRH